MPDSITTAPVQPEAKAQTATEKNGPANLSGPELARRFFKRDVAQVVPASVEGEKASEAPETDAPETTEELTTTTEEADEANSAETATETDAEAKPEAEDKATEEEALSPENSLDPKLQDKINRRIGKEVAKRKDLERQINELKVAMLQTQQPPAQEAAAPIVPLPSGVMPLANVNDFNGLVALQKEAKEAIRFVEDQLEREDFPSEGVRLDGKLYKRDDLRSIKRNARVTLEDHIPARLSFLNQRQQTQQVAYDKYPFLRDKASPEYLAAQAAYQQNPWLRNLPDADAIIGRQIMGMKYEVMMEQQKASKAAKKPASKARTANSQVDVGADSVSSNNRVLVTTAAKQKAGVLTQQLKERGGISGREFAQFLSNKSQLRNTTR